MTKSGFIQFARAQIYIFYIWKKEESRLSEKQKNNKNPKDQITWATKLENGKERNDVVFCMCIDSGFKIYWTSVSNSQLDNVHNSVHIRFHCIF